MRGTYEGIEWIIQNLFYFEDAVTQETHEENVILGIETYKFLVTIS